jgi:hypothetical protein
MREDIKPSTQRKHHDGRTGSNPDVLGPSDSVGHRAGFPVLTSVEVPQ